MVQDDDTVRSGRVGSGPGKATVVHYKVRSGGTGQVQGSVQGQVMYKVHVRAVRHKLQIWLQYNTGVNTVTLCHAVGASYGSRVRSTVTVTVRYDRLYKVGYGYGTV